MSSETNSKCLLVKHTKKRLTTNKILLICWYNSGYIMQKSYVHHIILRTRTLI